MQEALNRGAASAKDMELYLKIAGTPILGWVCRMLPFIRERVMGNPRCPPPLHRATLHSGAGYGQPQVPPPPTVPHPQHDDGRPAPLVEDRGR